MLSETLIGHSDVIERTPLSYTKLRDDAAGSYYKDLASPLLQRLFTIKNSVNSSSQKYLFSLNELVNVTIEGVQAARKCTVNLTVSGPSQATPAQLQDVVYRLLSIIVCGEGDDPPAVKPALISVLQGAY